MPAIVPPGAAKCPAGLGADRTCRMSAAAEHNRVQVEAHADAWQEMLGQSVH